MVNHGKITHSGIPTGFPVCIAAVWRECERCSPPLHRGVRIGFGRCCDWGSPETKTIKASENMMRRPSNAECPSNAWKYWHKGETGDIMRHLQCIKPVDTPNVGSMFASCLQASMDLLTLPHQASLDVPLDGVQNQLTHLADCWSNHCKVRMTFTDRTHVN